MDKFDVRSMKFMGILLLICLVFALVIWRAFQYLPSDETTQNQQEIIVPGDNADADIKSNDEDSEQADDEDDEEDADDTEEEADNTDSQTAETAEPTVNSEPEAAPAQDQSAEFEQIRNLEEIKVPQGK